MSTENNTTPQIRIGSTVRVHPELTSDPNDRRGQLGEVIDREDDILRVKFEDRGQGRYFESALILIEE